MADHFKTKIMKKGEEMFLKESVSSSEKDIVITKRPVKIAATLLIVLNVLLLATLLGLVIEWRELRKRSMEPHEQTLCINCTEIGLGNKELPEDVQGKIYREKSNNGKDLVCCGHTSDLLNWMVAKSIKDRYTGDRSSIYSLVSNECKKTTAIKPSGQLNGIAESSFSAEHNGVVHWNSSQSGILTDLITYKHGKLTVKQPGYYYIFSQLTFRNIPSTYSKRSVQEGTISLQEHSSNHLDHYIYHISHETGKHEKILEGSKSRCEMPSPNDEITSSLGAVFYLAADDEVFVKVSHPGLITPSKERNHFGLYMT